MTGVARGGFRRSEGEDESNYRGDEVARRAARPPENRAYARNVPLRQNALKVMAATQADRRIRGGRLASFASRSSQRLLGGLREAALQSDTAVRGAANVLTFGTADRMEAALDAALQGGADGWRQRYDANMAAENARNQYDAFHRSGARTAGALAGLFLGSRLIGPLEGPLASTVRMKGAAPLNGREIASLLALGAGAGLGARSLGDIASGGHRRSSWRDYTAAAIGGATGVAALPLGPARAGAAQGAATSLVDDYLNGRSLSAEDAAKAALLGKILGGAAGAVGQAQSNFTARAAELTPLEINKMKGAIGEFLGEARSKLNFASRGWTKSADPLAKGRKWIPDGRVGTTRFEDKFGPQAKLSPNQKQARAELGLDFYLNHFLPSDVGKLVSVPAAAFAPQVVGGNGSPERLGVSPIPPENPGGTRTRAR